MQPAFRLAVSLGAAVTVMTATWIGMPISTTHALTGGLVGAGLVAAASEVQFVSLGKSFVLPLLFSPVVALALTGLLYPLFRRGRQSFGVARPACVCIGKTYEAVQPQADGALLLVRTGTVVEVGEASTCVERFQGHVLGMQASKVLDGFHFLSGGAVGFARGLNDTPKIVALLLV